MPLCGTELSCEGCPLSLGRRGNLLPHELEAMGNAILNLMNNDQEGPIPNNGAVLILRSLGLNTAENNVEDFQIAFGRQSRGVCK